MYEYMKTYFYFNNMRDTIGASLKECVRCQIYKDNLDKNNAEFLQVQAKEPFEKIHLDLAEMPKSNKGFKYILVTVDHYSKWAFCIAIKNKEAATLANCIEKVILPACITLPRNIYSDNGLEFKNREISRILDKFGIHQDFSPPHYPQANGLAERTIGSIKSLIRTTGGDWEQNLPSTTITYNSTFHESINMSPADLLFGKTARVVIPDKDLNKIKRHTPYQIGDKVLRKLHAPTKMGMRFQPGYVIRTVNANNTVQQPKNPLHDKDIS